MKVLHNSGTRKDPSTLDEVVSSAAPTKSQELHPGLMTGALRQDPSDAYHRQELRKSTNLKGRHSRIRKKVSRVKVGLAPCHSHRGKEGLRISTAWGRKRPLLKACREPDHALKCPRQGEEAPHSTRAISSLS